MKKVEESWSGMVKKTTFIFISRNLRHIEIDEETVLLGKWTIKKESREVYLPERRHFDPTSQAGLRVIAEAYQELHETARRLNDGK